MADGERGGGGEKEKVVEEEVAEEDMVMDMVVHLLQRGRDQS